MSDKLEEILTTHLQDIKAGHDGKLKQAIELYCHKQVIEARAELLDMLITTKKTDPVTLMELSVELRKTL